MEILLSTLLLLVVVEVEVEVVLDLLQLAAVADLVDLELIFPDIH
jgi:hypothetical protein